MNIRLQNCVVVCAAALLLSACDTDISDSLGEDPSAGRADFSTFVAVGDSLTAGYADGALYRDAQVDSFPAIMAQQFALVGGGAFDQPLLDRGKTGSLTLNMTDLGRADRLVLVATGDPDSPAAPDTITPTESAEILTEMAPGFYNNIGVPGAKIFHAPLAGYGDPMGIPIMTANPYFALFASNPTAAPGGSSMLSDAIAQAPTFFSLWLGNNDLLLYAIDGADGTVNSEFVTPLANMTASFDLLLADLKTASNKGLVINVPDIATIPYFATVPYDAIPLTQENVDDLALLALGFNATLDAVYPPGSAEAAERRLSFKVGQNPVLINDETLADISGPLQVAGFSAAEAAALARARPATAKDLIVLPAARKIGVDAGGMYGITVPLVDKDVLDKDELADEIEPVRTEFNKYIEAEAAKDPDLLFFDAEAKLRELNTKGILYGSGGVSSTFAQGGFFSLDGIHPTARGNAVLANEIFKVINEGFNAHIPPVDPSDYTTVFYQ